MPDQSTIGPTLTRFQTCELFPIPETRFKRPTRPLAAHHGRQISVARMRDQILPVPVTVAGHDQPEVAIVRRGDPQRGCPQVQMRPPLPMQAACQLPHRLRASAPDDVRLLDRVFPARSGPAASAVWSTSWRCTGCQTPDSRPPRRPAPTPQPGASWCDSGRPDRSVSDATGESPAGCANAGHAHTTAAQQSGRPRRFDVWHRQKSAPPRAAVWPGSSQR